jgi:2-keto-4-pentenoate hydratase
VLTNDGRVAEAAERLWQAAAAAKPCAPVRDLLPPLDVGAAYRVQELNVQRLMRETAAVPVGRKIGLTSAAVQRQLGVDQPDVGTLLDTMAVKPAGTAPANRLLQPKVEAEIAFWLGCDLDGPLASTDDVRPAVAAVCAAIEIVDSRIDGWDITIVDTVADNASSGMFVVSDRRVPLSDFEPCDVQMVMTSNGARVSAGQGSACLGDPLNAVLWLARAARDMGMPLRAGELVLSGALGPMVAVSIGDHVSAALSVLGPVEVSFARAEPSQ